MLLVKVMDIDWDKVRSRDVAFKKDVTKEVADQGDGSELRQTSRMFHLTSNARRR
jgi:hypothetical protein